jgi:hypothetical protein
LRPELGTLHLPAEHRQLVPQDHDLQILVRIASPAEHEELQETADPRVREGQEHEARDSLSHARPANRPVSPLIEVSVPDG